VTSSYKMQGPSCTQDYGNSANALR
jgi:hypothetical protein